MPGVASAIAGAGTHWRALGAKSGFDGGCGSSAGTQVPTDLVTGRRRSFRLFRPVDDQRKVEPADQLGSKRFGGAHVRQRVAQRGGVRSERYDAAEKGGDRA